MDRFECHKRAERKDAGENRGARGWREEREREKKVHKGVCNVYAINYCIWTSITLIDVNLPLIGK